MKVGDRIGSLDVQTGFASSYLVPKTGAPEWRDYKDIKCERECDSAEVQYQVAYRAWSCRYAPERAGSGGYTINYVPSAGWAEAAEGDGIGEVLVGVQSLREEVLIWGGYAKSPELFKKNNRPRQIKIFVLQGTRDMGSHAISDVLVIAAQAHELEDIYGFQPLPIPDYTTHPGYDPRKDRRIAVEIESVYPGTQWRDTVISALQAREHWPHDCSTGPCHDLDRECGGDLSGKWEISRVGLRHTPKAGNGADSAIVNIRWSATPQGYAMEFGADGAFRLKGALPAAFRYDVPLLYHDSRCEPPPGSGALCDIGPPSQLAKLSFGRCHCELPLRVFDGTTEAARFKVSKKKPGALEFLGGIRATEATYCTVGKTLQLDYKQAGAEADELYSIEARRVP
jgi:hypothetical protein